MKSAEDWSKRTAAFLAKDAAYRRAIEISNGFAIIINAVCFVVAAIGIGRSLEPELARAPGARGGSLRPALRARACGLSRVDEGRVSQDQGDGGRLWQRLSSSGRCSSRTRAGRAARCGAANATNLIVPLRGVEQVACRKCHRVTRLALDLAKLPRGWGGSGPNPPQWGGASEEVGVPE